MIKSFNGVIAYTLAIFALVSIDQLFKYKIRQIGGFYICNQGISFGLILPYQIFWLFVCSFLLYISSYYLLFNKYRLSKRLLIGAILFFAGSFSNLLDRIHLGCVIDYIFIHKYLPVINFADIFIFCAFCLLLSAGLKK